MKIKHIIIAYSSIIAFASCNYLDYDETNGLNTREDIYRYFDKTNQMLTHVYTFMPQDFGVIGGAMRDCASDDAEFGATGGNIQDMTNGNWSAIKPAMTAGHYIKASAQPMNSFNHWKT